MVGKQERINLRKKDRKKIAIIKDREMQKRDMIAGYERKNINIWESKNLGLHSSPSEFIEQIFIQC